MSSTLTLIRNSGGLRHQIDGWDVHAGDPIDVMIDGRWVPGRYEWSFNSRDAACFYYHDAEERDRVHLLVPGTVVRFPPRG